MKTKLIIVALFFSCSAFAQSTFSGSTARTGDTAIFLPTPSITLTATDKQKATFNGSGSTKAGMNGIFLVMTLLALFMLTNKLNGDSLKDV